jgi:hypothetical protein
MPDSGNFYTHLVMFLSYYTKLNIYTRPWLTPKFLSIF